MRHDCSIRSARSLSFSPERKRVPSSSSRTLTASQTGLPAPAPWLRAAPPSAWSRDDTVSIRKRSTLPAIIRDRFCVIAGRQPRPAVGKDPDGTTQKAGQAHLPPGPRPRWPRRAASTSAECRLHASRPGGQSSGSTPTRSQSGQRRHGNRYWPWRPWRPARKIGPRAHRGTRCRDGPSSRWIDHIVGRRDHRTV